MSWRPSARNGTKYYYRNRRDEAGRVVTEYLGRGPKALAAAQAVARRRQQHEGDQRALSELEAHLRDAAASVHEAFDCVGVLMVATLMAQGYRRTNYGPWRRMRMQPEVIEMEKEEDVAKLQSIVDRAKKGDLSVLPKLRAMLDLFPPVWERAGNVTRKAESMWIELSAGDDLHFCESLTRFADQLRARLTRPSASVIEELLVDRVIACWLQMQYFVATEASALSVEEPPKLLSFRAKRQAQAQRMYESALSSLVAVQKLFPGPRVVTPPELVALPDTRPTIGIDEPTLDPAIHNRIEAYLNGQMESKFEELAV